jgi:hypothetical protein
MTQDGLMREAYQLLGISESDVLVVPRITPMLEQCGALNRVWDYIESSGTAESQALLYARKKLDAAHAKAISIEAFCVAAKISTGSCVLIVSEVLKSTTSMLRNVRALDKLGVSKSEVTQEEDVTTSVTALLPPIEDDVRAISGGFNGRIVVEPRDEEDEDEEED